jgi:hypothetical protein
MKLQNIRTSNKKIQLYIYEIKLFWKDVNKHYKRISNELQ